MFRKEGRTLIDNNSFEWKRLSWVINVYKINQKQLIKKIKTRIYNFQGSFGLYHLAKHFRLRVATAVLLLIASVITKRGFRDAAGMECIVITKIPY